jgi:hypothetical protein
MRLMYSSGGVDDFGGAPAAREDGGGKPSPSRGIGSLSLFIFCSDKRKSPQSRRHHAVKSIKQQALPKIRVETAPHKNSRIETMNESQEQEREGNF